jgi:hypothetical protein
VVADDVGVSAERHAAAQQAPSRVPGAQRGERELENLGDFGGRRLPGVAGLDEPDERVDGVVGGDRRRRLQGADELDRAARQADLLLGLAQGRQAQVGLVVVLAAARERDLARVPAQVLAALGEDRVEGAVGDVERDEDRGVDAAVDVEARDLRGVEEDGAQPARDLSPRARPVRHARRT